MNIKEIVNFSNKLDFQNKIKFYYYIILAFIFRVSRIKFNQTIKLTILGLAYQVSIGKGELDIIYHTNVKKDYTQLKSFIPSADAVCVDVGANIGSTSLVWAKTIKCGKIFAIEPHPRTYKLLEKNIEINKTYHQILPRQLAIGATDGDMVLFISEEGTMAMEPANYKWKGKEITVSSMSLDSFTQKEKIKIIDILKIDIEGYEAEALLGAAKTLRKTKRVVLEYHSEELREKCLELLAQSGFKSHEKGSLIFSWKN
jgi:FkbM family methyltransferase